MLSIHHGRGRILVSGMPEPHWTPEGLRLPLCLPRIPLAMEGTPAQNLLIPSRLGQNQVGRLPPQPDLGLLPMSRWVVHCWFVRGVSLCPFRALVSPSVKLGASFSQGPLSCLGGLPLCDSQGQVETKGYLIRC